MAQRGWAVTGVDFSSEAVIRGSALARAESTKVRWLVEDITSWSADEQFDLVTMLYLHLPAKQNRRMLDRAAEWVLPGGHLVVLGHDLSNLEAGAPGPLDPDVLYSTELLGSVSKSMRILRCEEVWRDLAVDPESAERSTGQAVDALLVAEAE